MSSNALADHLDPNGGEIMSTSSTAGFATLGDLEEAASAACSESVWAFIQGGAGEERTLRRNREAFHRWALRPRVFSGIKSVDLSTTFLGEKVHAPFYLAPMAYQGLIHADGERGTARAAATAKVLAMFSTLTTDSLERIAEETPYGPRWFQLYLQPELSVTRMLVERAEKAGYSALVLTADVPLLAIRDRQRRTGFAIDASIPLGNGPEVQPPARELSDRGAGMFDLREEASVGWEILDQLREFTKLPIVVKGILTGEDARSAVNGGARGVVVSNHGGRQLDGAAATLDVLPEVVQAVGTKAEVYLDGGVRRASDMVAALALGARGVGIGRPVLWALATGGAAGVSRLIDLLRSELASVMALLGRNSLTDLEPSLLQPMPP